MEQIIDTVFDACSKVLSKGPKYEIETYSALKRQDLRLKQLDIAIIERAVLELKNMGFIKNYKNQYSLI